MPETFFDTKAGMVVAGAEAAAVAETAGYVSLAGLLTAEDFPFRRGDFSIETPDAWPPERCLAVGRWVVGVLEEDLADDQKMDGEQPQLTRDALERLHVLGLGPSRYTLGRHFKTIQAFGEAAGIRTGRDGYLYDSWSMADYVQYAENLAEQLGRKPKDADYGRLRAAGKGPSPRQIFDRLGGVRVLNEYIGYPNIHEWSPDDYLTWGVRVGRANNDGVLTARLLTHLSKQKRGPSVSIIRYKFGSLETFQTDVASHKQRLERSEEAHRQELLAVYCTAVAERLGLESAAPDDADRIHYAAKYLLASECLPPVAVRRGKQLLQLPTGLFLASLQDARPTLDIAAIEQIARTKGIAEDLWPIDGWRQHLHVPEEQLGYKRSGNQARFVRSE